MPASTRTRFLYAAGTLTALPLLALALAAPLLLPAAAAAAAMVLLLLLQRESMARQRRQPRVRQAGGWLAAAVVC
jgi:hypothetical protein